MSYVPGTDIRGDESMNAALGRVSLSENQTNKAENETQHKSQFSEIPRSLPVRPVDGYESAAFAPKYDPQDTAFLPSKRTDIPDGSGYKAMDIGTQEDSRAAFRPADELNAEFGGIKNETEDKPSEVRTAPGDSSDDAAASKSASGAYKPTVTSSTISDDIGTSDLAGDASTTDTKPTTVAQRASNSISSAYTATSNTVGGAANSVSEALRSAFTSTQDKSAISPTQDTTGSSTINETRGMVSEKAGSAVNTAYSTASNTVSGAANSVSGALQSATKAVTGTLTAVHKGATTSLNSPDMAASSAPEPTEIKSYEEIVEANRPNETSDKQIATDQSGVLPEEVDWKPAGKGHWEPIKVNETDQ